VRVELIKSFYQSQRSFPDWYFHSVNAGDDHVHLLTEIPPKYSVSQVVKILKAKASIDLKKKFPFIGKIYEDGNIWSVGYFVSTVGLNEEQIKKYIEKQNQYDMGFGVENEFS
jgi:putative transposase